MEKLPISFHTAKRATTVAAISKCNLMDCTYKTNKASIGQSIITGCNTGGTATSVALTPPTLSSSPIGNHDSYVEFISQEQATQLSLRESAFWPLINIVEMVADGNCGFRAAAHIIHGR